MAKEEKMLSAFSNILFVKENIRVSPKDLQSVKADNALSQDILDIIKKYEPYFKKIEEIVEFIDDIRHPTGIFKTVENYALDHGTVHKRKIKKKDGSEIEVFDYYEPDDPDEYVMIMIDHIGLISPEKDSETGISLSLHQSISKLSSTYLVQLRNKYNYIPVVIQQQASAQESLENKKYNKLKPTLDGLAENKLTQRDANVVLGLFSPYRHEIPDYFGYDITFFKDNIRFLEILANREGLSNTTCPLYFDGAVNYFSELPLPSNIKGMTEVRNYILELRKKIIKNN
jgi:hypothetical protein